MRDDQAKVAAYDDPMCSKLLDQANPLARPPGNLN
jgi:hypothetical protein